MSKTDAWMPLYVGDYLRDTHDLDAREHGAYLLLLMRYWSTGPIPDDDRYLAAVAHVSRSVWSRRVGPVIRRFFEVKEGHLHHKRADVERDRVTREPVEPTDLSAKRRAAAEVRWGNRRQPGTMQTDANAYANPDANASSLQCNLHAESQSEECKPASSFPLPRESGDAKPDAKPRFAYLDGVVPEPSDGRPTVNGYYLDATFDRAMEAAGIDPAKSTQTWQPVIAWLRDDIRPDTIVEAIRRRMERVDNVLPTSLAYFDRPIRDLAATGHGYESWELAARRSA